MDKCESDAGHRSVAARKLFGNARRPTAHTARRPARAALRESERDHAGSPRLHHDRPLPAAHHDQARLGPGGAGPAPGPGRAGGRVRSRAWPRGAGRAVHGRPDRHHDRLRGAVLQPDGRRRPLRSPDPRHPAHRRERPAVGRRRHRRPHDVRGPRRRRRVDLPHHRFRAAARLQATGHAPAGADRCRVPGRGRDEHGPLGRPDHARDHGAEAGQLRDLHARSARDGPRHRVGAGGFLPDRWPRATPSRRARGTGSPGGGGTRRTRAGQR